MKKFIVFFLPLLSVLILFCQTRKGQSNTSDRNYQPQPIIQPVICEKPTKRYSQNIEDVLSLELEGLKSIPKDKLSESVMQSTIDLFNNINKGLDRDLLLFRICEISSNRGLTNAQTSELLKLVINTWDAKIDKDLLGLVVDAVKDSTVYFSVVNKCNSPIKITYMYLEHLKDSIDISKRPGNMIIRVPRTKLGKVKITGSDVTEVMSYESTFDIPALQSESFEFDFSLDDYDNRSKKKVDVNWKNSKIVIKAVGACFGNDVTVSKDLKLKKK